MTSMSYMWWYKYCRNMSIYLAVAAVVVFIMGSIPVVTGGMLAISVPVGVYMRTKGKQQIAIDAAAEAKAIADKPREPTVFDCEVFEERQWEAKLIEAGMMDSEDMVVCDNKSCLNCRPTRQVKRANEKVRAFKYVNDAREWSIANKAQFDYIRKHDDRYKGYRYEDYVFQEKMKAMHR